jgi:hypothetical protein
VLEESCSIQTIRKQREREREREIARKEHSKRYTLPEHSLSGPTSSNLGHTSHSFHHYSVVHLAMNPSMDESMDEVGAHITQLPPNSPALGTKPLVIESLGEHFISK